MIASTLCAHLSISSLKNTHKKINREKQRQIGREIEKHTEKEKDLISPLNNPPRKLPKANPLINLLPQIRLRKNRQRIPRHHPPVLALTPRALHKMRHRPEPPAGNQLERLARLERETVTRDVDLDYVARAGPDVQACFGVRRGRQFGERGGAAAGG